MPNEAQVLEALRPVEDPEIHRSIVELNMVRGIEIDGGNVKVTVALTVAGCPMRAEIIRLVTDAVAPLEGVAHVDVDLGVMTEQERAALAQQLQGGHAHGDDGQEHRANPFTDSNTRVLAISSGKGGVGKSSVTTNLAVALAQRGHKVAAIDADVWGFSMPRMLGIDRPPTVIDDVIVPPDANGVTLISMGFFAREDQPVVWRGPMLHKALEQFLTDVHWGEPDYLIVDMPPGTGDIALSMAQFLPAPRSSSSPRRSPPRRRSRSAPRTWRARSTSRSSASSRTCRGSSAITAREYRLFGEGGGQELADQLEVPLLGQVPLVPELRAGADNGEPIVVSHPDDPRLAGVHRDGGAPRRRDGAQAHLPNPAQDRLTARVQRMEVRIGVVYTARELTVETDDSVDGVTATIESAMSERRRVSVAHRQEGPPGRRAGRQDRVRRDRDRRRWSQGRLRRELARTPP